VLKTINSHLSDLNLLSPVIHIRVMKRFLAVIAPMLQKRCNTSHMITSRPLSEGLHSCY